MHSPLRFIGFRLFIVLMAVMLVSFSIHTYLDIKTTSSNLTDAVSQSAMRASDLIVRSTRYSMLLNRKEDVHQTIRTLGSEPGFVGVSVYNKDGEVIFSTDSTIVGRKVDMAAEACHICHASGEPLVSVPADSRMRLYEATSGDRVLGLINPIRNEPACYNATCHAHTSNQQVLGVLDVKMSMADVDRRVAAVRRELLFSSLVMIILIAGASAVFIHRVVRKPIRRLKVGMADVARGDLDAKIETGRNDEIGEVGQTFNRMAGDLKRAREELEEWARMLEQRVAEKSAELERAHSKVIHMEKMASLGKLSASVAHEINNPLFGILTYSKLGLRELEQKIADTERLRKYLTVVEKESNRCGDIVKNLLGFARASGGRFERHRLRSVIEQAMLLIDHHLEVRQISAQKELIEDDEVVCDPRQIQQALIAICMNAVEAMSEGGRLSLRTSGDATTVTIHVTDTGMGIPQAALAHVFEPFFTTKESHEGLGLGLAVVYGIVQRHHGSVDIESRDGEGTTVTMVLPREQPAGEEPVASEHDAFIAGSRQAKRGK
jgi:two-component system NtrC family sensor kinase